jgi:hypothetical protein
MVCKILRERSIDSLGVLFSDGINLAVNPDISVEDGIGFFSRVMSTVTNFNEDSLVNEYESKSKPWIKAIKKETDKRILGDLIAKYINIVNQYVKTNIQYSDTHTIGLTLECSMCGFKSEETIEEHCLCCGSFMQQFISTSRYVDSAENDIQSIKAVKDGYDKFREHYLRYQGRTKDVVDQNDMNLIRKTMTEDYTLDVTEENRTDIRRLVFKVINKLKLGKYRSDLNLILHEIWGYDLPDYSEYDDLIEKNWRIGQQIFEEQKQENDPKTIGYNDWRLYKELTYVGITLDEEIFQISTSKQMKKRYDDLWNLRCSVIESKQ